MRNSPSARAIAWMVVGIVPVTAACSNENKDQSASSSTPDAISSVLPTDETSTISQNTLPKDLDASTGGTAESIPPGEESIPSTEGSGLESPELAAQGAAWDMASLTKTAGETWKQFSHAVVSSVHMHEQENATTALNLAAPFAIVLGPEALKSIYEPVFGSSPRTGSKDSWFAASVIATRIKHNPTFSFFNPTEYTDLGGTLLQAVWEPRATQYRNVDTSVKPRSELDSQYLVSLRSFLGDACRNLLAVEMGRSDTQSNILYSGETLDPAKASGFLRKLTGLPQGPVSNVDPYIAAFPDLLPSPLPASATDRTIALRVAYQHLCVAMASDVRVITR